MGIFGSHYSAYDSSALELAVLLAYANCNLSIIFKDSRKISGWNCEVAEFINISEKYEWS